jgi:putative tryptophan/tyrosine transport system substrate-binding protein
VTNRLSCKRREFITLLGGAAAAWSFPTSAQQPKVPTIAFLGVTTAATQSQWTAAFVQRLGELGWVEGRTVTIEYRWAEGRFDRLPEMFAELVRRKVDVIFTHSTPSVIAAKQATSITPIVFALVGAPVAAGLVTSLARPGGNVTGVSNLSSDLGSKRLELLREVAPALRRFGILTNVGNPSAVLETGDVEAAAHKLGLEVATVEIRRADDIVSAVESLKGRVDALIIPPDALLLPNRIRINTLALGARLPTMHGSREYVEAGGLMSYGPNYSDLFRRAADYVDRILRGVKPADLPVEQPTKFDLIINLTTGKVLGLTIPPTLLGRADEVIE